MAIHRFKINDNWAITCMRSKSLTGKTNDSFRQFKRFVNITNQTNLTEVLFALYDEGNWDNKLFSDRKFLDG